MLALRQRLVVALVFSSACMGTGSYSCIAQGPTDLAKTALAVAPQDAAFLVTVIDTGKSWERFSQGNFVKSLRRLGYIRALEQEIATQWDHPSPQLAQYKSILQSPNVRDLLRLAADMASQEFFIFGEDDWCDAIENVINFQNEMMTRLQDSPEAMAEYFNELDRETVDGLRIPTTIMGFRLTDAGLAQRQLDALEGIVRLGLAQDESVQPFLEKLRRRDFSDGQTLTLTLDASMIPLDEVEEDNREAVEKFLALVEGRSVSLSVGVKGNLLLIGFGESEDLIEQVGQSGSQLLEHERMSVLKDANVSDLRSIVFASKRWRQSQWNANFAHYFRNLLTQLAVGIETESLDSGVEQSDAEDWKDELLEDANRADAIIGEMAADFGEVLAWSNAIPGGTEGWTYDWNNKPMFENAQPLQILEHAGSNSLYLLAFKQSPIPALSELCDLAMERIPTHAQRFIALAEEDEEDRELALQVFNEAWPLVEEGAEIIRDKISPALDEQQSVLSLAASWTTRELGNDMPLAEEPLTLPELGLACKLSDRQLFLEGCQDLYGVFDRVVDLVRELAEDAIPEDYQIPRPVTEEIGSATSYHYEEFASYLGIPGFKPQLVVAEDVVVWGYSDRQVQDMLNRRALVTRPAWLTDQLPVAAVSYVDYGGMLAALRPWLMYGLASSGQPLDQPLMPFDGPVPSGNDLLQIWDTFSAAGIAAATVSIQADGPTVARWVWVSR